MKRRTKIVTAMAVAVPIVLGGGATAYGSYYRDRALPGSTAAGIDVAGMTRAEVAAAIRNKADGVVVDVRLPDGSRKVTLTDLGTTVDVDATVARVFDANSSWRSYAVAPFEPRAVDVVTTSDRRAFHSYVAKLGRTYDRPPTDATVTLGADRTTFVSTPGVAGRTLDARSLRQAAATAAARLAPQSASAEVVEQKPALTTAEAGDLADAANAIVKTKVVLKDGSQAFTASAREKASWVQLPEGDSPSTAGVVQSRVADWVAGLAKSVDTAPVTGLRYVNSAGATLRVVTQASDGRAVTNADALAAAVTAALNTGKSGTGSFKTKAVPAAWTDKTLASGAQNLAYPAAPGEKWIDVNLSRHTMTPYVGATPALASVSMVNGAPATPSDIGTFHIYQKNALMTMRGQNADGSDYETPDVPWSSFYNGGEALHGAYWRKTFGYAASHGCINLPIPTAKWIFDWAPMGTPVVVHN